MPEPLLHTPEETAAKLGLGRTTTFALIKSGEIESITIGRLRRVPDDAIEAFVAKRRAAQRDPAAA